MKISKQAWLTIALVNLCMVAILGFTLRSKILFPLEIIDFGNLLLAHSNFAFGGWVTLTILILMTYEVLPEHLNQKKIYGWLLAGILFSSVGKLVFLLWQGYTLDSIFFSILFVLITFIYCYTLINDIIKAKTGKATSILAISSLISLILSSVGPFVRAYLIMSHSGNFLMDKDSNYTYLHFQYNGFFALGIFALFINEIHINFTDKQKQKALQFARLLICSVIFSLFISYLWHFPKSVFVRSAAITGCIFIVLAIISFWSFLSSVKEYVKHMQPFIKKVGLLSLAAFVLKSLLQMGTIIPSLGKLVFGDRTIIIGYLHLVLLGFVSLYLLTHLLHNNTLDASRRFVRIAIMIFAGGIIVNEAILMVEGFGNLLMISNSNYNWLLWAVSIWLLCGAILIAFSGKWRSEAVEKLRNGG